MGVAKQEREYHCRALQTKIDNALAVRQRANDRIAKLSAELRQARDETKARLGLTDVQSDRLDPTILDTLSQVQADGDCWIWLGTRNNKGLPRVRDMRLPGNPERSACVLLDQMLNGSDGTGIRYPNCRSGRDCVNPAHKRTRGRGRQFSGAGMFGGNPERRAS